MKLLNKWIITLGITVVAISLFPSCKQCKKDKTNGTTTSDTTSLLNNPNIKTIDAPHGDTTLIPVLSGILQQAFEAAQQKDYDKLGSLLVYRGADDKRHGSDIFNTKNAYEKSVVKITGEVLDKWTAGSESVEFARVFELPQPDGRTLQVIEVIIVFPKKIERKFFGFLQIGNDYKIADVTSYL